MSARERERREHVAVRLAELRRKLGDLLETCRNAVENLPDPDPSWGPVGSLARQRLTAAQYEHLLMLHNDMLALERARKAADNGPEVLH